MKFEQVPPLLPRERGARSTGGACGEVEGVWIHVGGESIEAVREALAIGLVTAGTGVALSW